MSSPGQILFCARDFLGNYGEAWTYPSFKEDEWRWLAVRAHDKSMALGPASSKEEACKQVERHIRACDSLEPVWKGTSP